MAEAHEVVEGNLSFIKEFLQRLLNHYHCTFKVVASTTRNFKLDLLEWLQLVLDLQSIDLNAECLQDPRLLIKLFLHCHPQLEGDVTAAATSDNLIQLAEEKFDIPVLFTTEELDKSGADAEKLLLLYLSYYCNPHSPTQSELKRWVSNIVAPSSMTTAALSPVSDNSTSSFSTDKSFDLSSGHWNNCMLLYQVVRSIIGDTLPNLSTMPNIGPSDLAKLAITEAQRHLDISFDFPSDDLLIHSFHRLVFLEKLYSMKDATFQPHESTYFILQAGIAKQQLVGSEVILEIDYQNPSSKQHTLLVDRNKDTYFDSNALQEDKSASYRDVLSASQQESEALAEMELKDVPKVREGESMEGQSQDRKSVV